MFKELNEQEKKVIEQYSGFPEGKRLTYTKAHETEFIVTMHYIHKYLTQGAKIAKPGAPVFIAFCLQDAPLIHEIFQSENPASGITSIGYDREQALVTDNTGSSRILDTIATVDNLMNAVCKESSARKICRFSQDGISQIISGSVNTMSEESYAEWIAYLIATAERTDLMGFSDHIVDVVVKGI